MDVKSGLMPGSVIELLKPHRSIRKFTGQPVAMVLMGEKWQPVGQSLLDEYGTTMRECYKQRSGGKLDRPWSADMESLLGKESRPYMKAFP